MTNGSEEAGFTTSERYLAKLCRSSFLTLWSYPNLYTDRGATVENPQGKELCDMLVVFDKHMIIFSDKSCEVPDTGDVHLDWGRWFKKTIKKSAEQIYGAEKWLREFPSRVYLDKACTKKFPLDIPSSNEWKIHRIVVALGAGERTAAYYGGGSRGSLMIVPQIIGDQHLSNKLPAGPFRVGQVFPDKGFVHVFDDITLDILMKEIDTISDFVQYLNEKEAFFKSGRVVISHGEEETLAYYLSNLDNNGNPTFDLPDNVDSKEYSIVLNEGLWDEYLVSDYRQFHREITQASSLIDELIEHFSNYILKGELAYGNERELTDHEKNLRFLAAEPRKQRAMMAHAISQKIVTTPRNVRTSIVIKSANKNTLFVFLLFPKPRMMGQFKYRKERQAALEAYAHVIKMQNPDCQFVYGVATEPGMGGRSEDLMSFDFSQWSEEEDQRAKLIQNELDILTTVKNRRLFSDAPNTERPDLASGNRQERRAKRSKRNT